MLQHCNDYEFLYLFVIVVVVVFRSNPDILRSNLDADDIKGGHHSWTETLRLHADPGSCVATPIGSTEHLNELNDSTN